MGIFYRLWFGMHACSGSSTDAEWLAKIAVLFALGDWAGDVLLAIDSTVALMADLTRPPPSSSYLTVPFRAAIVHLRARIMEAWLPPQHDTGDVSLLARLNVEAEYLAELGAVVTRKSTAPWVHRFAGRCLATHH